MRCLCCDWVQVFGINVPPIMGLPGPAQVSYGLILAGGALLWELLRQGAEELKGVVVDPAPLQFTQSAPEPSTWRRGWFDVSASSALWLCCFFLLTGVLLGVCVVFRWFQLGAASKTEVRVDLTSATSVSVGSSPVHTLTGKLAIDGGSGSHPRRGGRGVLVRSAPRSAPAGILQQ